MRSERANLRKSTAIRRRVALRDGDYRSRMLCVWEHKPAAPSRAAARLQGCRVYCYLPTAHLRRVRHAEAKVDRHIAEDAKHADASVLQLRLRADTHASGQVDAASSSRPVGGGGVSPPRATNGGAQCWRGAAGRSPCRPAWCRQARGPRPGRESPRTSSARRQGGAA